MRSIHYALAGVKYHKKVSHIILGTTSILLLLTVTLQALKKIVLSENTLIHSRWQEIEAILPGIKSSSYNIVVEQNQQLYSAYDFWYNIVFGLSIGSMVLLSLFLIKMHQKDIRSWYIMGLSSMQVFKLLFLEVLFPILISFGVICFLLMLFQPEFQSGMQYFNTFIREQRFDQNNQFIIESGKLSADDFQNTVVLPFSLSSITQTEPVSLSIGEILWYAVKCLLAIVGALLFAVSLSLSAYVFFSKRKKTGGI